MMKCVFGMQINVEVFYKLIVSFWVCMDSHAQSTQNKKFAKLCNISRKTWSMKLIFCFLINTKVFYKLLVSLWVCIARHAQSTQNNKFGIFLQDLKKEVSAEVDFLHANNYESFLHIVSMIFDEDGQAFPKFLK